MTAALTITFEDGTSRTIELEKAVEIDIPADRKQSISFLQTAKGSWVMSFTKPMFQGKKFKTLSVTKDA